MFVDELNSLIHTYNYFYFFSDSCTLDSGDVIISWKELNAILSVLRLMHSGLLVPSSSAFKIKGLLGESVDDEEVARDEIEIDEGGVEQSTDSVVSTTTTAAVVAAAVEVVVVAVAVVVVELVDFKGVMIG
jgi:hypothetical protein